MKIKFKKNFYELIGEPYIYGARFMVTMSKGDYTYDEIIADTENSENIIVMNNDGEVVGVYTGFTTRTAITIMDNIQVEFENTDIQAQIAALTAQVQTQETAIADLGDTVNSVSETNETQDNAINDLADAVNELSNTEV